MPDATGLPPADAESSQQSHSIRESQNNVPLALQDQDTLYKLMIAVIKLFQEGFRYYHLQLNKSCGQIPAPASGLHNSTQHQKELRKQNEAHPITLFPCFGIMEEHNTTVRNTLFHYITECTISISRPSGKSFPWQILMHNIILLPPMSTPHIIRDEPTGTFCNIYTSYQPTDWPGLSRRLQQHAHTIAHKPVYLRRYQPVGPCHQPLP